MQCSNVCHFTLVPFVFAYYYYYYLHAWFRYFLEIILVSCEACNGGKKWKTFNWNTFVTQIAFFHTTNLGANVPALIMCLVHIVHSLMLAKHANLSFISRICKQLFFHLWQKYNCWLQARLRWQVKKKVNSTE